MRDLSIIIPSRNEMFLQRTIEDILAHLEADTEVIAVLDGNWADPRIPDHPRVRLTHSASVIGQRAATNLGVRMSMAQYVMKCDAHVSVDQGFDRKLIEADREIGRSDVTQIPAMYNLHAFNWKCQACGKERYQGPTPTSCIHCASNGRSGGPFERVMYWDLNAGAAQGKPIRTEFWRFDHELHFQYFSEFKRRPEARGELVDVMSSIGACFFMRRDRFFEIEGLDEATGSWGQYGTEIACKSWLSGGRHIVNKRTWFAHLFRTQGAGFGFPYPNPGSAVDKARKYSQDLWLNNRWGKQILPLAWLVEKFSPVPGWHDELHVNSRASLQRVRDAANAFRVVLSAPASVANHAAPMSIDRWRKQMPGMAVSSAGAQSGEAVAAQDIVAMPDQPEMGRVAARPIVANVIENERFTTETHGDRFDELGVHDTMDSIPATVDPNVAVAVDQTASPDPAASDSVEPDFRKQAIETESVEIWDREKLDGSHAVPPLQVSGRLGVADAPTSTAPPIVPGQASPELTKGLVYYTDCRGDETILKAVRIQLQRCANGHRIVAATLQPVAFGNKNVVLPLERGTLTMFRQILAGLELLDADVAFLVEHDVLYHPSHFDFTPADRDTFYFNQNTWRVDAESGRALFYYCNQVSGLCAYRETLIDHYRKRIAHVEQHGFSRNLGFEPGTNSRARALDGRSSATWMSPQPNIDIKSKYCLTPGRWRKDQFRNQNSCLGWTESDRVPGWGVTLGRFREFLQEVGR